jgi:hypothetical protein
LILFYYVLKSIANVTDIFFIKKIKFNLRVLLWYVSRSIKYISLSDMFMTRYLSNFRVAMFHSTTQGLSFNNHEYLIPHKQKFDYFLSSFNIIFNVLKIIWIGMTNGIRVACFRVSDWIIHYLYMRSKLIALRARECVKKFHVDFKVVWIYVH